jgi:thiol-disulfide isomerase/thioredoxin
MMALRKTLAVLCVSLCFSLAHADSGDTLLLRSFPVLAEKKEDCLENWQGEVRVVNFWATWCPPCVQEIPLFSTMQKKWRAKGVQFIGIAIDEVNKIQAFAEQHKPAYPFWIGDVKALALTRELGNPAQGLPFTLILDAEGILFAQKAGLMPEKELESLLHAATQKSTPASRNKAPRRACTP